MFVIPISSVPLPDASVREIFSIHIHAMLLDSAAAAPPPGAISVEKYVPGE